MSQNQGSTSPNGVSSQTLSTGDAVVNGVEVASRNEESSQDIYLFELELDLQGIGSQFEDHPNVPSDLSLEPYLQQRHIHACYSADSQTKRHRGASDYRS